MAGKNKGKAPAPPRRAAPPTPAQARAQGIALADVAPTRAAAPMAPVHAVDDVPDTDDDDSLLAALAGAGAFGALPESLDWASQQLLLDALADLEEAVAYADDAAFTPSSFTPSSFTPGSFASSSTSSSSSSTGSTSTRSLSGADEDEFDDEENEDDQEIVVSLSALRQVGAATAPAKSPAKVAIPLTAQLPRPPVRPALAPAPRPSAMEEALPPNATRQDRNRLAARRTRERQKNRVMALEDEVRRGRQDRRQLLDRVEHLEARNKALADELTAAHRELDLLRRQLAKENAANNVRVPSDGADSLMDVVVSPGDEVVPDLQDGAAVVPTSSPPSSSGESAAAAVATAAAPCMSAAPVPAVAPTRPLAARTVQLLAAWRLPVPPAALAGLLISAVVFLYTFGPLGVPAAVRPLALVKPSLQEIMRDNADVPWATDGHRPLPPIAETAPASPALAVPDWDWVRTDAAATGGSSVDTLEAALAADDLDRDDWTAAATEPAPMEEVEEDAGAEDDAGEPASAGARRAPPVLLREDDPLPPRDLVDDAMLAEWLQQAVPTALPAIVHTLLLALQAKQQHRGAAGVVAPLPPVA